jgi:hypothetical protein
MVIENMSFRAILITSLILFTGSAATAGVTLTDLVPQRHLMVKNTATYGR